MCTSPPALEQSDVWKWKHKQPEAEASQECVNWQVATHKEMQPGRPACSFQQQHLLVKVWGKYTCYVYSTEILYTVLSTKNYLEITSPHYSLNIHYSFFSHNMFPNTTATVLSSLLYKLNYFEIKIFVDVDLFSLFLLFILFKNSLQINKKNQVMFKVPLIIKYHG